MCNTLAIGPQKAPILLNFEKLTWNANSLNCARHQLLLLYLDVRSPSPLQAPASPDYQGPEK
jgi:hypothetical protein